MSTSPVNLSSEAVHMNTSAEAITTISTTSTSPVANKSENVSKAIDNDNHGLIDDDQDEAIEASAESEKIDLAAEAVKAAAAAQSQAHSGGSERAANSSASSKPFNQNLSYKQLQIQMTDCTYFLMGNCMRPAGTCYYRHCEATLKKTAEDICPTWQTTGMCTREDCDLRHPRPQHVGPGRYNQKKMAQQAVTGTYTAADALGLPKPETIQQLLPISVRAASQAAAAVQSKTAAAAAGNKFSWKAGQTTLPTALTAPTDAATASSGISGLNLTGLYKNPNTINDNLLTQDKIALNGSNHKSISSVVNEEIVKDERTILVAKNGEDSQEELIRKVQMQINHFEADKQKRTEEESLTMKPGLSDQEKSRIMELAELRKKENERILAIRQEKKAKVERILAEKRLKNEEQLQEQRNNLSLLEAANVAQTAGLDPVQTEYIAKQIQNPLLSSSQKIAVLAQTIFPTVGGQIATSSGGEGEGEGDKQSSANAAAAQLLKTQAALQLAAQAQLAQQLAKMPPMGLGVLPNALPNPNSLPLPPNVFFNNKSEDKEEEKKKVSSEEPNSLQKSFENVLKQRKKPAIEDKEDKNSETELITVTNDQSEKPLLKSALKKPTELVPHIKVKKNKKDKKAKKIAKEEKKLKKKLKKEAKKMKKAKKEKKSKHERDVVDREEEEYEGHRSRSDSKRLKPENQSVQITISNTGGLQKHLDLDKLDRSIKTSRDSSSKTSSNDEDYYQHKRAKYEDKYRKMEDEYYSKSSKSHRSRSPKYTSKYRSERERQEKERAQREKESRSSRRSKYQEEEESSDDEIYISTSNDRRRRSRSSDSSKSSDRESRSRSSEDRYKSSSSKAKKEEQKYLNDFEKDYAQMKEANRRKLQERKDKEREKLEREEKSRRSRESSKSDKNPVTTVQKRQIHNWLQLDSKSNRNRTTSSEDDYQRDARRRPLTANRSKGSLYSDDDEGVDRKGKTNGAIHGEPKETDQDKLARRAAKFGSLDERPKKKLLIRRKTSNQSIEDGEINSDEPRAKMARQDSDADSDSSSDSTDSRLSRASSTRSAEKVETKAQPKPAGKDALKTSISYTNLPIEEELLPDYEEEAEEEPKNKLKTQDSAILDANAEDEIDLLEGNTSKQMSTSSSSLPQRGISIHVDDEMEDDFDAFLNDK